MAAEQGNPYAQYLLGKLCLSGDGVPQDKDAAYDWFQKAQAQGHDYAGFFMDRIERPESPNVLLSATRLLYHMGKDLSDAVRPRRKAVASRLTASGSPSCAGCAWLPDTRRTITSRSRRQHHVDGLVARFKICAAIDKENTNDNFLITLRAGGCYSVSRVVVVDTAKGRWNAHGEETGKWGRQHPQAERRTLGRALHGGHRSGNGETNRKERPRADAARMQREAAKGDGRTRKDRCDEAAGLHGRRVGAALVRELREAVRSSIHGGILQKLHRPAYRAAHRGHQADGAHNAANPEILQ